VELSLHNPSRHDPSSLYSLVHDLLDRAAADVPHAPAVQDASSTWSYERLVTLSHAFAHWLRGQGIGPGDRVVTQIPSTGETVALLYGTSRSGAVFVPLNPAMKPFHLRSVLANCEPGLVIADGVAETNVREVAGAVPVHNLQDVWREVTGLAARGVRMTEDTIRPDDVAVLVYTSGSTAAPKAVICPHAQMTFASGAIQQVLGYRPDDVVFCRFPMSWDYGLYKVLLCALGRSRIVFADGESDLVLLKRMREVGATVVPLVPSLASMIATLAARDTETPPPIRLFTNTGAALPQPLIDTLRATFPRARVVRQYGQTECKRVSAVPPERERERPDSVGLPLPGTRVLILDADGRPVPTGETGEIVAAGPHVMPGYWRAPEITARTFRRATATGELRLHTGDYGHVDEDGFLYFEGRRDDMFKRKGIRMSTVEIEAAAVDVPGVRAAAVLPPTDRRDMVLFVDTDDLSPQQVLRELAQRLEPLKVPALCRVLTNWPLSAHGKTDKKRLLQLVDSGDA
jgi:acyl-CoA synthetase (AMP-forming)/AMP-acid ligase II